MTSKPGIGLICGAALIGVLIIFFGRTIYPDISITFRIGWVILGGVLTGGASGLFLQYVNRSLSMELAGSTFIGVLLFGLITVFFSFPAGSTIVLGIITGSVSGGIIKLWSVLNVQKD